MSEQQLKAMQAAIRGCEQMDLEAISDILHSDLVRVTRPSSLNVPKHNKDQCVEYYRKLFDNWAKIEPVSRSLSHVVDFLLLQLNL